MECFRCFHCSLLALPSVTRINVDGNYEANKAAGNMSDTCLTYMTQDYYRNEREMGLRQHLTLRYLAQ